MNYLVLLLGLLIIIIATFLLDRNVTNAINELTDVCYIAGFAICMMLIIDGIRWLLNKYKDSNAEYWDIRGEVIEISFFRKRKSAFIGGRFNSHLHKYIHEYQYIKVHTDDHQTIDIVFNIATKTTELDYTMDSEYAIGSRVYLEVKKFDDDPYYYDSRINL